MRGRGPDAGSASVLARADAGRRALAVCGGALVLAAAGGGFWAPAAGAASSPKDVVVAIEVTGIHVADWQYRSPTFGRSDDGWIEAEGSQTLGFSYRRPQRIRVTTYPDEIVKLTGGPRFAAMPLASPRVKGSLQRVGRALDVFGRPASEGCDIVGCSPRPPLRTTQRCGRRPASVTVDLDFRGGGMSIAAVQHTDTRRLYRGCMPESGRYALVSMLETFQPAVIGFKGALARMSRLKRNERIRFHDDGELGAPACPLASPPRIGFEECGVTDVTVEARRVR